MVCLSKKKIGELFPMNCSNIGHSYEAFTYLFSRNMSNPLLSANNNPFADLLK